MKKIGKRSIWISIVVATMLLTGCGNQTGSADRATGSDAADFSGLTTEVAEVTTEEATTEAVIEATVDGSTKPEAVPTSTIGGGKKKAEETTEEKKPSTTESAKPSTNHSNSGSASSGQSTTPKPSNSGNSGGNSGNSGSGNSGNSSSTPSPKPSTPATTEAPAAQHQHNYNVWVKTKDAWDETVIDTPEQRIDYPEQGYYLDAVKCHICGQVFTSMEALDAHADHGAESYGSTTPIWVKTRDPYTEVIPAKTHTVHHDEEGYWACSCGARK